MYTDLRAEGRMSDSEHEERMKGAKRRAEWELGSDLYAGAIVAAYMNPEADAKLLAAEMAAES